MLSKSKDKVLKTSAALHVLFHDKSNTIEAEYSTETIPKKTQTNALTEIAGIKFSTDIISINTLPS